MEYGSTKMEERLSRSPGGKLALWAFYTWCGYFVWAMARYIWVMSRIPDAPGVGILKAILGSTAGKWLGALVGFLFMALVGALLGSIAWYTRPRPALADARIKLLRWRLFGNGARMDLQHWQAQVRKLVEKPSSAPGRGP